ncbi:MAG: hypothetical protein HKN16_02420 [Saprospiraceae bacterium]|nr:hypothetical protein [Saprospiraceae bacterium]
MIKRFILLFSGICLLALGCGTDDLSDADLSSLGLSDQIRAYIFESFQEDGTRHLNLYFETIEEYNCTNFELEVESQIQGNRIQINILGLKLPSGELCKEGISKAAKVVDLGNLTAESYDLDLTLLGELHESGSLDLSSLYLDLNFPTEGWMQVDNNRTTIIPSNTVWGYYLSESGHYDDFAKDFIDGLEGFGTPLENNGFFGSFSVDNGQVKIIKNEGNRTDQFTGFGIRYEGEISVLEEWVFENYCTLNGELGLYSTQGEFFPCN